jgi:hypothetical protein
METTNTDTRKAPRPPREAHASEPLADVAQAFSSMCGAATLGVMLAGPIGAVVGGVAGVALFLGARGRLRIPKRRP